MGDFDGDSCVSADPSEKGEEAQFQAVMLVMKASGSE